MLNGLTLSLSKACRCVVSQWGLQGLVPWGLINSTSQFTLNHISNTWPKWLSEPKLPSFICPFVRQSNFSESTFEMHIKMTWYIFSYSFVSLFIKRIPLNFNINISNHKQTCSHHSSPLLTTFPWSVSYKNNQNDDQNTGQFHSSLCCSLTHWRRFDFAITHISHRPQPEYTRD